MPFLRLYSRDVPLDEKRSIAQKLISITIDAFHLTPVDRDLICIQFVPRHRSPAAASVLHDEPQQPSEMVLEVLDDDLTVEKITAFVQAATPVLSRSSAASRLSHFARLLGIRLVPSRQVAFQFSEMRSPDRKSGYKSFAPVLERKAA